MQQNLSTLVCPNITKSETLDHMRVCEEIIKGNRMDWEIRIVRQKLDTNATEKKTEESWERTKRVNKANYKKKVTEEDEESQ